MADFKKPELVGLSDKDAHAMRQKGLNVSVAQDNKDYLYTFHDVRTDTNGNRNIIATHTPLGRDESGKIIYDVKKYE